jgi:beta-ketoacyl-acyl-carrier-protein synthase II
MSERRVVVTGMGVISPVGLDVDTMWGNLVAGRSGIGPITLFDASDLDVRFAGEAHGFDPLLVVDEKEARRNDRFTLFAIAATEQALAQSGLRLTEATAEKVGVVIGSAIGGIWTYTRENGVFEGRGPKWVSPFLIPAITVDAPAVQLALRTGARGPNLGVASTCASGADAVGLAFEAIRRGQVSAMLAGGFEAALTRIGVAAFCRMRALSRRNEEPETASRPFDATRDGFVLSEGGALLVLEDLEFALDRGVEPLAEILGYASTSDALHVAAPSASGAGAARCLELALQRTGLAPAEISYINAHGTSTPAGDCAEVRAIRKALGASAERIPLSSTKSMTGHLIGGAGALETVISVQTIRNGVIPPTINLHNPDPECDLDFVAGTARIADVRTALSLSFGFGGHNAVLVIGRFES